MANPYEIAEQKGDPELVLLVTSKTPVLNADAAKSAADPLSVKNPACFPTHQSSSHDNWSTPAGLHWDCRRHLHWSNLLHVQRAKVC